MDSETDGGQGVLGGAGVVVVGSAVCTLQLNSKNHNLLGWCRTWRES